MKEELKNLELNQVTQRVTSIDLFKDQVNQITLLGKKLIVLESDKEYLAYTLSQRDEELEKLCKNV